MTIDIKISEKPINYLKAIGYLENRLKKLKKEKCNELIWILEHPLTYTAGPMYNKNEIIDKKIRLIRTNRGGKITLHNKGQMICYFLINLNKRKKDIRLFLNKIEKSIIGTFKEIGVNAFSDSKNIGIWVKHESEKKKIAAIGIRVKQWIAYHGFSINIDNNLDDYKRIIPCGIKDKKVTSLEKITNKNYKDLKKILIKNLIKCLNT